MLDVDETERGIILSIRVIPKSSRNEIRGVSNGSLQIKITAPPEKGMANKECIKFLAKKFGVNFSSLSIIKGEKSREKRIMIEGIDKDHLLKLISEEIR